MTPPPGDRRDFAAHSSGRSRCVIWFGFSFGRLPRRHPSAFATFIRSQAPRSDREDPRGKESVEPVGGLGIRTRRTIGRACRSSASSNPPSALQQQPSETSRRAWRPMNRTARGDPDFAASPARSPCIRSTDPADRVHQMDSPVHQIACQTIPPSSPFTTSSPSRTRHRDPILMQPTDGPGSSSPHTPDCVLPAP